MNRYIFADVFDFSWHKRKMEEQNRLPRCQYPECYHPIKVVNKKYDEDKKYEGKFCLIHSCYHERCLYMVSKYRVCLYHLCGYPVCNNWLDTEFSLEYQHTPSMEFCCLHMCRDRKCDEPVIDGQYFCYQHMPKTIAEIVDINDQLQKKRKT